MLYVFDKDRRATFENLIKTYILLVEHDLLLRR